METFMNLWNKNTVLQDVMRETEGRGDPMTVSEARERLALRAQAQQQAKANFIAVWNQIDYDRKWWRHDHAKKEIVYSSLEEDDRDFLFVPLKWLYFTVFYQSSESGTVIQLFPDETRQR
jgi:hypothetical protein